MLRSRPGRVHLLAHANPITRDIARFGWRGCEEYLAFIRAHLPRGLRLTVDRALLEAEEDPEHGGRRDDARRIRDLNRALADPATRALVAASGGAWLTRLLPQLDFAPLLRRAQPIWVFGFSELTTLVNLVATYRMGRGVYWLCPNYLAWKLESAAAARAAFGAFWRELPAFWQRMPAVQLHGTLVAGRLRAGAQRIRLIGGCLSVLAAMLPGRPGRRLRPEGRWLVLEDLKEEPYRIDRCLATLKLAGWFERCAGVLIGDFHTAGGDTQAAVVELLPYHLPRARALPVVVSRDFGHIWPMTPLPLNRPLVMTAGRGRVRITGAQRGSAS